MELSAFLYWLPSWRAQPWARPTSLPAERVHLLELAARCALGDQPGVGRLDPEEMFFYDFVFVFFFFLATRLTPSLPS